MTALKRMSLADAVDTCRTAVQVVSAATALTLAALVFWSVAPAAAGWSSHVVLSGSMLPKIQPGDIVVAQPVNPNTILAGQVIVFDDPARPGTLLVHRVVRRNIDGAFVTRGDANRANDSTPVPPENVRGLARLRIPYVGLPAYWRTAGSHH